MLPRAPAELANFVNQFVGGRGGAFSRILRKTTADLAGYGKLRAGPGEYDMAAPHNLRISDSAKARRPSVDFCIFCLRFGVVDYVQNISEPAERFTLPLYIRSSSFGARPTLTTVAGSQFMYTLLASVRPLACRRDRSIRLIVV